MNFAKYDIDGQAFPSDREGKQAYRQAMAKAEAQFKADLEEEFGLQSHPKKDILFRLAWEMGHSSGYSEVHYYYEDMSELLLP